MPRAKKDISKDLMFQKIMPSAEVSPKHNSQENSEEEINDFDEIDNSEVSNQAYQPNQMDDIIDIEEDCQTESIDSIVNKELKNSENNALLPPRTNPAKTPHLKAQNIKTNGEITPSRKMAARTIAFSSDIDSEGYLINTIEKLVFDNLESVLSRFKCCKCDRCKKDILALALNSLQPKYVVATKNDPPKPCRDVQTINDVTTALVRSVIKVKSEPRH